MTTVTLAPSAVRAAGVRVVPIGAERWRVLDRAGRALGQVVASGDAADRRFQARRFHPTCGAFLDVGVFCRAEDALECLRTSR